MPLYIHANPNPIGKYVDDCVIRAIAIATNRTWDDVYAHVCLQGYIMKNMPSVNKVSAQPIDVKNLVIKFNRPDL